MLCSLLPALLPAAILCSGAPAGVPLTVMSFNVRHGTAPDGDNSWPQRRGVLVNMVRSYAPDVVGVQECLVFQAQHLVARMPEYHWIGMGREADGTGEMAAIFYKHEVLSPIRTGNFWLSETPDVPGSQSWATHCTRMATWVRFRHVNSDRGFCLFNTHFDHGSAEAREMSARLLLERIAALAGDQPVIVTGDFNDPAEDGRPWSILTHGRLRDSWVVAQESVGPEVTYHGWAPPRQDTKDRIDWILISDGFEAERVETIVYNEDGRYPSDHCPVFARVLLKAGE